jgi:hypothetical protein
MRRYAWQSLFLAVAIVPGCERAQHREAHPPPLPAAPNSNEDSIDPNAEDELPTTPPNREEFEQRSDATLVREADSVSVYTRSRAEEILLVSTGLVWIEPGEVWGAFAEDDEPRIVSRLADPHSLTTNGRSVFWIGEERSEQLNLANGEVSPLPRFAGQGQQEALAFGDALYGRSLRGGLWRIDSRVTRLPFHADPSLSFLFGFQAGGRALFLPARRRVSAGGVEVVFVRYTVGAKASVIAVDGFPHPGRWAVGARGDLAFVANDARAIAILGAKESSPHLVLEDAGAELLCWCGRDLCTFDDATFRRRSLRPRSDAVLATGIDAVRMMTCTDDRIAWLSDDNQHGSRLVSVAARR